MASVATAQDASQSRRLARMRNASELGWLVAKSRGSLDLLGIAS